MSLTPDEPLRELLALHDDQSVVHLLQELVAQSRRGAQVEHLRRSVQFSLFWGLAGPEVVRKLGYLVQEAQNGGVAEARLRVGCSADERFRIECDMGPDEKLRKRRDKLRRRSAHAQRGSAPARVRTAGSDSAAVSPVQTPGRKPR